MNICRLRSPDFLSFDFHILMRLRSQWPENGERYFFRLNSIKKMLNLEKIYIQRRFHEMLVVNSLCQQCNWEDLSINPNFLPRQCQNLMPAIRNFTKNLRRLDDYLGKFCLKTCLLCFLKYKIKFAAFFCSCFQEFLRRSLKIICSSGK